VANEYLQLIDKVNSAIRSERVMRIALSSVLAIHKPRIFEKGLDGTDAKIGTYSTKPISIAKKNQARQTGKTYFKGGYAEYKTAIGKNPGFVNLRNTDQMRMDYGLIINGTSYGFGFQNELNYNKSQWLQEKYDKDIFDNDSKELDVLANVLVFELQKSL
jgi:hypothetical protein